jgi:hypothetical protein
MSADGRPPGFDMHSPNSLMHLERKLSSKYKPSPWLMIILAIIFGSFFWGIVMKML